MNFTDEDHQASQQAKKLNIAKYFISILTSRNQSLGKKWKQKLDDHDDENLNSYLSGIKKVLESTPDPKIKLKSKLNLDLLS